jgi:hypothetical protein
MFAYYGRTNTAAVGATDTWQVWGAQAEPTPYVTQYIPTTATTASRNTWYDMSGNSRNGTLVNDPIYSSQNGGSIVFDGVNDYITISQREISPTFTYETFLIPTNVSKDQMYVGTVSDAFYIRILGSKAFLSISADFQRTLTHDTTLENNKVYHIVSIYNGVQLKIYVNNVLTLGTVINASMTSWGADRIGRWKDADQRSFVGNIYTLRAYNRELTAQEISQNYNALKSRFALS